MPLDSNNKEQLSFKKLFGKAHTQFSFALVNEGLPANVQMASSTVFGEPIDPNPAKVPSSLVNIGDNDGVVEKVRFEIEVLENTTIGSNQSQAYGLKLPVGYTGTSAFSGDTFLYNGIGQLQIVPPLYGELAEDFTTDYDPVLYDGNLDVITPLSTINWNLDFYNGILFVQNPPAGYDNSVNRPQFLDAYLYVGKYLSSLSGSNSGSTGSGERIEKVITQASHGFVVGDVLAATGGTFIKAIALEENPEALGIVTIVNDVNSFTLTFAGYIEQISGMTDVSGNGLSGNTVYYLSTTLQGKLTPNEPILISEISKPLIYIIESGASGNIFQVRGNLISSGNTAIDLRSVYITTDSTINLSNDTSNSLFVASGTTLYNLPLVPENGAQYTFADGDGNGGTIDITINGNGKNIIDGTSATINTSYGSITVEYNGVFWSVTSFA
jgi:hypothetical protein